MAGKISDLTPATTVLDADMAELLQAGNNLSVTRKLLLQGSGTATDGDVLRYNSNLATPTYETVNPRWRLLAGSATSPTPANKDYTTGPPSTSTLTVLANTVTLCPAGTPLKYTIGGTTYYGIVTAASGTTLTIAGASLSGTLTALYVGQPELVVQLTFPMTEVASFGDSTSNTQLLDFNREYFKWRRPKAYLVSFSGTQVTADTSAEAKINVLIAGSAVSTEDTNNGLQLSGTAGTWIDSSAIAISTANYDINWDESLEIDVTVAGTGTGGSYMTVSCTFILA